jgi:hypothetical protein
MPRSSGTTQYMKISVFNYNKFSVLNNYILHQFRRYNTIDKLRQQPPSFQSALLSNLELFRYNMNISYYS